MDLRQAADNTLSYQLDRVSEPRRAERRQRRSEPRSANVYVPADRRGDQDVAGSHHAPTFLFSLRLRVAQHSTFRLAAET